MRRLFTSEQALERGLTRAALRWGERDGRWRRIERGVFGEGPDDPSPLDRARAVVLRCNGVASGHLAGVLHQFDAVDLPRKEPVRRRVLPPERVVWIGGLACTDALQTLIDLAAALTDDTWEQALESALRTRRVSIAALDSALPGLSRSRTPGTARIRRVLAKRPPGAPPTESLLETRMVQLARTVADLPDPVRQLRVVDSAECFVARVDLAWPELGLFVELDGQHHAGQPVYDARRETAVVAASGWLCGRFTWTEVVRYRVTTARRLGALAEQARRRPLAS